MTGQYTIDIVVSKEDVQIIKDEFKDFLEEAEGFTINIRSDTGVNPSKELSNTLKKLFFHFIMTLHFGNFKGVN